MTTATGRHVSGPAGRLFVDDGGRDRGKLPVVLAHSFGGSTAQWAPQLLHLRGIRRAVALDVRGHGASDPPKDGDYATESLAADIGAVLDGLGLAKVVLVGHGLGAEVALEYAGTNADRVAGLLLAAAPARIPAEQAAQMIAGLEQDYERMSAAINVRLLSGATDGVRALIARDATRVQRDAALRIIEASLTYDPIPALERYRGPMLAVVTSEADTPNEIHRLFSNVPHDMMDGTSHWMQLDDPEGFNRILDRFLERIDESR
ncbi:MAG: alpha/beta fold hydrolase [Candidatus Limnocylindrales bacterium]